MSSLNVVQALLDFQATFAEDDMDRAAVVSHGLPDIATPVGCAEPAKLRDEVDTIDRFHGRQAVGRAAPSGVNLRSRQG